MGPNFKQKVRDEFARGRLIPPVLGRFRDLRIAATLMRDEGDDTRGVLILANTDPNNTRCLRVTGEAGALAVERGTGGAGNRWSTTVGISERYLASLVSDECVDLLAESGGRARSSSGESVIELTIYDPSSDSRPPTINNMPLDEYSDFYAPN